MLINKTNVRKYALDYARRTRPKFTRVSGEFLEAIEATVRQKIINHINSIPSVGVTIK